MRHDKLATVGAIRDMIYKCMADVGQELDQKLKYTVVGLRLDLHLDWVNLMLNSAIDMESIMMGYFEGSPR